MILLFCLSILLFAGFLTVVTEAFTHFLVRPSFWSAFREFLLGSWLFAATASLWATSLWLGLRWLGVDVGFLWTLEILSLAHLPMLAYPLTIMPTIGYRLEQILRMAVFSALAVGLSWQCDLPLVKTASLALPGWFAHFLVIEWRLLRQGADVP